MCIYISHGRCDQRGEDITNKNFEYSAGVPKNAKPFEFDPEFDPEVGKGLLLMIYMYVSFRVSQLYLKREEKTYIRMKTGLFYKHASATLH